MSVASPTGRVEGSRREAIRIRGLATSSMHPYRPFAARSLAAEVLTLVLALNFFRRLTGSSLPPSSLPPLASPACLPVCLSVRPGSSVTYCSQQRRPGRVPRLIGAYHHRRTPCLCVWV
jgi:hypothetical protein